MSMVSLGNLAQTFMSRQAHTDIRSELSTLSSELTTGIKSSPRTAMNGNTAQLSSINRALTRLDGFDHAAKSVQLEADVGMSTLGSMRDQVIRLTEESSGLLEDGSANAMEIIATDAKQAFVSMVESLNVSVGDRSLFSGTKTSGPALVSGDEILANVRLAVTEAGDASGLQAAIDEYFSDTGGFSADNYVGGAARDAVKVSGAGNVQQDIRADDPEFRSALAKVATLIFAGEAHANNDSQAADDLVASSLARLSTANAGLVAVEAKLGISAARAEEALSRNSSERATYEEARLDFIAADPFETASRFEERRGQLETLYSVTSRLSRLSFADYLR